MNGNGGTVAARVVAREAAKTIMSGPASGVMAAAATLAQSGVANAITYDMGGTSTDVALIHGGVPQVSAELTIDYGLPIHVPMVDVRSVGAGGGSIASINAAGMLQVGPAVGGLRARAPSATAAAAREPTITDANLVLGRLDPAAPARGARRRSPSSARARDFRPTGWPGRWGLRVDAAAAAVIRLGNTHMAGAIRMVSLARGLDPRDFTLFAFGGAGPLHAVALARELGIPEVLVPARPGLTNALGCLVADLRQDFVNTLNVPLDARRHGRGARHPCRPARARHRHQRRGAERDRRDHRAARRRHAVPRPDASDPRGAVRGADVSREDHPGAVRGRLLRPLPGAAAGDQGGAGQPRDLGDRPAAALPDRLR